ncbi:hypothetical protein EVJ58_g4471 [Rhodofomes roseus]|uniref:Uncharacterized protein n=1 Tax=Rhodofomes roseus TaxID=34475 RepID=A0A4Y9YKN0_9APHY|nr:hypothetical protein EVJ58_g4471 [Rhodofomes roseus]
MPTCIVCLEVLKDPAALPCVGELLHYPAYEASTLIIVTRLAHVDPNLVPHHLQPHVSPAIRRLHLEYSSPSSPAAESSAAECDRLRAEVASLQACCVVWRKRAAVHAAATLGVIGLARMARDTAMKMKTERDEFEAKHLALQKTFEESQRTAPTQPTPPTLPKFCDVFCATPLPLSAGNFRTASRSSFRMPSPSLSDDSYCSDCAECSQGSVKRKRIDERDEEVAPLKRTRSNSSGSSPSPFAKLALAESFERKPLICPDTSY